MNQTRSNFLALILLDALEDENESDILNILERNDGIDPSYVPVERGISPLHYVCGMDNEELALQFIKIFLQMGANPNICGTENMTPLHVAAIHGRQEIVRLLMQHGARVDAYDDERKSPVHYAIEECHFEVVQLMRDFIFLNKYEQRQQKQHNLKLPAQEHANNSIPNQKNFNLSLQKRVEDKKSSTPVEICNKNLSVARQTSEDTPTGKYTPNRVHYNYDVTSPYYINITHRRDKPQPKYPTPEEKTADLSTITIESSPETVTRPLNIFMLTKENLDELSQTNQERERSRISLIEVWRDKVKRSNARRSILREFDDINEMIQTVMEHDHLNFKNTILTEKSLKVTHTDSDSGACGTAPTSSNENLEILENRNVLQKQSMSLGQLIQKVSQAHLADHELVPPVLSKQNKIPCTPCTDSSYQTVPEIIITNKDKNEQNTSNFIRSPNSADFYLQMTEAYVHTDDENGLVFYETKLLSNDGNRMALQRCEIAGGKQTARKAPTNIDTTTTSQSTDLTLPLDYETDALRAELTTFGEPPGPITKSTKRLYIKRLIKCKRKSNKELQQTDSKNQAENKIKFSVELYRSIRSLEAFQRIPDYMKYDTISTEYFANHKNKHKMREGHLKQSFIYMLIDPRISCNLPGESIYLEKFDVWKRFLESVFYVGKGKTSRPYSHLYDAMKLHSRLHNAAEKDTLQKNGKKVSIKKQQLNMDLFKTKTIQPQGPHSRKLQRILDIWANNQGVVCLHVFHNIMPTEAYTREAAIIDALGLTHLTNVKRGDYYGPAKTWTMKEKKFFGIALLYKAMKIYLAEGESQLSPSDLI